MANSSKSRILFLSVNQFVVSPVDRNYRPSCYITPNRFFSLWVISLEPLFDILSVPLQLWNETLICWNSVDILELWSWTIDCCNRDWPQEAFNFYLCILIIYFFVVWFPFVALFNYHSWTSSGSSIGMVRVVCRILGYLDDRSISSMALWD